MIIGPVTDLRNYRECTPRFAACLGRRAPVAEVHLIHADLLDPRAFVRAMTESAGYFGDEGMEAVSYHLLDDVLNDLILQGLTEEFGAVELPRTDRRFSERKETFHRMIEGLNEASQAFQGRVIAVAHEGIFLDSADLETLKPAGLASFLRGFEQHIESIHAALFCDVAGNASVFLENSPLRRGMRGDCRHLTDQVLVRVARRLSQGEALVLDVSHRFLFQHHMEQADGGGEDVTPDGYEDIRTSASSIGWVHLNDCSARDGGLEGMPLFQPDSLIDWKRLIVLLRRMNAPMILEIEGAEKDFSCVEESLTRFRAAWDAATEDGGEIP